MTDDDAYMLTCCVRTSKCPICAGDLSLGAHTHATYTRYIYKDPQGKARQEPTTGIRGSACE